MRSGAFVALAVLFVPFACRIDAVAQSRKEAAIEAPSPRVVRVDVIVTDARGRTISTLKAADFEVREEGAVQSIDAVRFVSPKAGGSESAPTAIESDASERAEAANPNARLVGIFLDDYHVNADNSARVRDGVSRFIRESLTPEDLVVVMRPLDSLFAIRLTRDREALLGAVTGFEGRQGDYAPRNAYERSFMAGTPARIEQMRAQVTLSALNAMANHVGSLNRDARKTLIVVSEGLLRVDRRRGLEALPTIDTITRSANRYNVSIYPVNPSQPSASAAAQPDPDVLQALAASTDGRAIGNAADLGAGMRPIAADAGAYYLLQYKAAHPQDGRFHDVQVTVKKTGVAVRTRKGYWSAFPDEAIRAASVFPRQQVALEPPRHISPFIQPWFGASRAESGKTRVMFVWEPTPGVPGTKRPTAARVVFKALAPDDTALFDGPVLPTGPLRPDASDDLGARAVFEAPPGTIRLRMSIENEAEQPIDSDVREIMVRDLSGPVALGTPEVFRGRTARDFRAFESAADVSPVSSREFSRAERLMIRVPVYGPPAAPPSLTARLTNRKGQVMHELPVRSGDTSLAEIDLPLAAMAIGEYRVEIAAVSPAGQVRDILEFRVTN